jgi:hypothetical protein
VVDAFRRCKTGQQTADDEGLQVGGGLADGEQLVHRVELGWLALPAGPRQRGGHHEGADRAAGRDLKRLLEPGLMVREQLAWVESQTGPWAGSSRASGSASINRSEPRYWSSASLVITGWKPIDGVMCGST